MSRYSLRPSHSSPVSICFNNFLDQCISDIALKNGIKYAYQLRNTHEGVIMLNEDQIKGKWTEIKSGIRNLWGKITDDDLEKVKGNINSVAGIIQEQYGETQEDIKKALDKLMNSFDNETDKNLKLNNGISSFKRRPLDPLLFSNDELFEEDNEYEGEERYDDSQTLDPTYKPKRPDPVNEDWI